MRSLGVITGFTAQVDAAKLGLEVGAFTEIRYMGNMTPDDMMTSMKSVEEVQAVFTLAGDPDVLAELQARDHTHVQDIINRLRRSGGTVGTKTHIFLGSWRRNA